MSMPWPTPAEDCSLHDLVIPIEVLDSEIDVSNQDTLPGLEAYECPQVELDDAFILPGSEAIDGYRCGYIGGEIFEENGYAVTWNRRRREVNVGLIYPRDEVYTIKTNDDIIMRNMIKIVLDYAGVRNA